MSDPLGRPPSQMGKCRGDPWVARQKKGYYHDQANSRFSHGEYAAARRYQDLSELTINRARQVVLDFIGTMLGGYQTELGQLASDYAAQMLPGDDASIVGDGRRSTTEGSAWANAVMGKFLGMDDSHSTAGHVASQLVPAALALGEKLQLSGQQVITALAVGYDVMDMIQPRRQ